MATFTDIPQVEGKMPVARDWLLTVVNLVLAALFVFWNTMPNALIVPLVGIYFIALPWWFWRSFRLYLYALQHLATLTATDYMLIIFSSLWPYAVAYFIYTKGVLAVIAYI